MPNCVRCAETSRSRSVRRDDRAPSEVALPSTSGERLALAHAVEESQRRRETFLGPHHLLLALLRDPESPVARVCAGHGVTYLAAGAALGRVLETTITDGGRGDGEPPASPPAA